MPFFLVIVIVIVNYPTLHVHMSHTSDSAILLKGPFERTEHLDNFYISFPPISLSGYLFSVFYLLVEA